jgi:hypothetical protein
MEDVFEDREPSIFPHPLSAWWMVVIAGVFVVTGLAVDFFDPDNEGTLAAAIFVIGVPCLFLLAVMTPIQLFRLLLYFVNRVP